MVVDAFVFTAGTKRAMTYYSNSNRRTNNDITFGTVTKIIRSSTTTVLNAASPSTSLKPAALYLMDSGKALARSGELLIELTTELDLYGGALSASGAQIRNAGDCLAQAAASMRFKTGAELVVDEIREAATCLNAAVVKLQLAVEEAEIDDTPVLARTIGAFVCDCVCVCVCVCVFFNQ